MKQIIIVRKDLNMSKGKMAAQVAHASMAFLTNVMKKNSKISIYNSSYYSCRFLIHKKLYEDWICGFFTKIILEAKNKHQLEKVYKIAEELGLEKGVDYFPIKDNCYTELEPEEVDENGVGRTLTCVGFIPLSDETADKISKKYQLYHDNKNDIDPWDGEKSHAKNGFVEKYCL